MAWKLKPLFGHTKSFVKYSTSFINEVKYMSLDLDDLLVSFDVLSLFTKIPIQEPIEVINQITDDETTSFVGPCLTSTIFSF